MELPELLDPVGVQNQTDVGERVGGKAQGHSIAALGEVHHHRLQDVHHQRDAEEDEGLVHIRPACISASVGRLYAGVS
jgi:hypothetical protein